MWKIPKPNITALESFNTCIAGIRNADVKARMEAVRPHIIAAEAQFDHVAANADLHLMAAQADVAGLVTVQEMKDNYDQRMVKSKSRGRDIYDRLMIAAQNDMCPFCGHRDVSTLDHCLPKAQYPALSTTPINLVPCCKDCNHEKGNPVLNDKGDQLLNAYYDDVENTLWLYAEIVPGSPAGVRYWVQPNAVWDNDTKDRVSNHFSKLKLAKLYASQGARQLLNMRGPLTKIYGAGGINAVYEDLLLRWQGCNLVHVNSWQTALYHAAASSHWYCDGGFRL